MAEILIIRGDSYALRRPMWTHEIVDINNEPMDFAGCTILTTYKQSIVPLDVDPDDGTAIIRHGIQFDVQGNPTVEDGLFYRAPGVLVERFPSSLTQSLEPGLKLEFDMQLKDANGEFFTFVMVDHIVAADSFTNRFDLIEGGT